MISLFAAAASKNDQLDLIKMLAGFDLSAEQTHTLYNSAEKEDEREREGERKEEQKTKTSSMR